MFEFVWVFCWRCWIEGLLIEFGYVGFDLGVSVVLMYDVVVFEWVVFIV